MKKLLCAIALYLLATFGAQAGVSCSLPFNLLNGTTADASQVMANYNAILACLANSTAESGANSSITALLGLTTPLAPNEGGSTTFIATSASTGAANAQIVGSSLPSNFNLTTNYTVVFVAGYTNTGPMTLLVNSQTVASTTSPVCSSGTCPPSLYRSTPSGPQPMTGGEVQAGQIVVARWDGTYFEQGDQTAQFGGYGPATTLASSSTTDLGTIPSHIINVTGTTTISSFGHSASTTYPVYLLSFGSALTIDYNQTNCSTTGGCINIPGNANLTVGAGDTIFAVYLGTGSNSGADGNWKLFNYQSQGFSPSTVFVKPQGYLTVLSESSGGPYLTGDETAKTTIYYSPVVGNYVPIYNGSSFIEYPFSELSLALSSSSQSANGIYDVFIFNNSGTITAGFGPAWTTATAGSGARGTGAGTTQLTLVNGLYVNAVSMTVNNGATTYTVAANQGTYVGSVYVDATAGQVSCYVSWGGSRVTKWGVWNAYNQQRLVLQGGDSSTSWTYATNTWRESNGATADVLTTFTGLAQESVPILFQQEVKISATALTNAEIQIGVGYNSTSSPSGTLGDFAATLSSSPVVNTVQAAQYSAPPSLGINNVTPLENVPATSGVSVVQTFFGTQTKMTITAAWHG